METYDIVMLAVLGCATLFGFLKGFAWQVASLASLTLSYFCAYRFADQIAPLLNADPRWSKYLAMLLVYCGTGFAVWMGFRFVSGAIDKIRLREFDRQMGGLVGVAKGVLLCTIITFFAVSLSEQTRGAVLRSKSGVYIAGFLHKATPIMPPEWIALLGPYLDKLDKGLNPNQQVEYPSIPTLPGNLTTQLNQAAGAYGQQMLQQSLGNNGLPTGYTQGAPQYGPAPNYQQNYQPQYTQPQYNQPQYAQPQMPQPQYYTPGQQTQPMNPYSSGS
ncbi:MAG: CvpA family protein [Planctomycetia bacterium]|nr:CvpA family protein [Planctomycetia bacterium]